MKKETVEGILNSPLFMFLDNKEKDELRTNFIIFDKIETRNFPNYFFRTFYGERNSYDYKYNEELNEVIKKVVITRIAETNLITYLYDEETCQKIKSLIRLGNFNSKLLIELGGKITFLTQHIRNITTLKAMFYNDVNIAVNKFYDTKITEKYKELKDCVDKVVSGVNNSVFLKMHKESHIEHFNNEINEMIKDKFGYNFTDHIKNYPIIYQNNRELRELGHYLSKESFNLYEFINLVDDFNGFKHAEKIITYCFEQFEKEKYGKLILENKLPLCFAWDFEENMLNFVQHFFNREALSRYELKIEEEDSKGLLYPIYDIEEDKINLGKSLFESFVNKAFNNNANKFMSIFNNLDAVVQDEDIHKNFLVVRNFIECFVFGYDLTISVRKYVALKYEGFCDDKNIYKRFYYVIYLLSKYCKDFVDVAIYETFYDFIRMIDFKYNLKCSFTKNDEMREEKYTKLKSLLNSYKIDIEDSYKNMYIIALLDRKCATFEEKSHFAEYEMLGDAIYNFAVSELSFFNKNEIKILGLKQDYNSAKNQLKIAKNLKLEELYIANKINKDTSKFDMYDDFNLYERNNGNYLSDSLEMIIGVIYLEFGLETAIGFSKKIITETFKELAGEERLYIDDIFNLNPDDDYFSKIFFDIVDDPDYNRNTYSTIEYNLLKLALTIGVGTETKEKRKYISQNYTHYSLPSYERKYVSPLFVNYLQNGLFKTIDKLCKFYQLKFERQN